MEENYKATDMAKDVLISLALAVCLCEGLEKKTEEKVKPIEIKKEIPAIKIKDAAMSNSRIAYYKKLQNHSLS
ncbi:MAG: hypothetical protein OIF36_03190 [Alphaproteobacteria bacterium]|nr:hypothetical protein [Alphaproteobacteria bacterium]MCV6599467.1 hypothetical protein [Alphaproteobacteria bacterium]